jgi:hypothetical protein
VRVLEIHVLMQSGERREVVGIEAGQAGYVNLKGTSGELTVVEAGDVRAVDVRVIEQ